MIYVDLFRSLHDHQVRYLLVGGLAMNLHGVPRMTMDVDLDGLPITLAGIDDMIALKRGTGRLQDESDIEHLERIRAQ